jgi:PTH1 family peptidyl-tRNA hydrolase
MQADFVLGKWLKNEEPLVKLKIDISVQAIESFITSGIEQSMTLFNNVSV